MNDDDDDEHCMMGVFFEHYSNRLILDYFFLFLQRLFYCFVSLPKKTLIFNDNFETTKFQNETGEIKNRQTNHLDLESNIGLYIFFKKQSAIVD